MVEGSGKLRIVQFGSPVLTFTRRSLGLRLQRPASYTGYIKGLQYFRVKSRALRTCVVCSPFARKQSDILKPLTTRPQVCRVPRCSIAPLQSCIESARMASSASGNTSSIDGWASWAYQELAGKAHFGRSKYQRERWHLRALHDESFLDKAALEVGGRLAALNSPVEVRIGSIWVDHTPQAHSSYREAGGSRDLSVKCELADLVIVTLATFQGAKLQPEHVRAVLVQAKVTRVLGTLDAEGRRSSSFKERNLLECCSSSIKLTSGTGSSAGLGTYDLGCSGSSLGLANYAQYLTIPSSVGAPPSSPYQAMWPTGRHVQAGSSMALGDALLSMLDVGQVATVGAPLAGHGVLPDWPKLIRMLTGFYQAKSVNRLTGNGRGSFPRIQQSKVHFCWMTGMHEFSTHPRFPWGWPDFSHAIEQASGGGGDRLPDGDGGDDGENGANLPVLLVHANFRHPPPERPAQSREFKMG